MYNTPQSKRFTKSDFDEQIFPVLTCMTAYHTCLHIAKVTVSIISLVRTMSMALSLPTVTSTIYIVIGSLTCYFID